MSREQAGRLAWIAWGLCALCAGLTATGLLFLVVNGGTAPESTMGSPVVDAAFGVFAPGFPVVGALIASRQPRNAIGWLFIGTGLALGLELALLGYATRALVVAPGSLPGGALATLVADLVWVPVLVCAIGGLCLLFPDGRLPSARWRPAIWLGGAFTVAYVAGTTLKPGPLYYFPAFDNPLGVERLGTTTRLVVDAVGEDVRAVVRETMQPAHVSLWRRGQA